MDFKSFDDVQEKGSDIFEVRIETAREYKAKGDILQRKRFI